MNYRSAITAFVFLIMIRFAWQASAAHPKCRFSDPFALEGAQNILEEAHFGIVNGKLTCGIPYRDMFAVRGLWAPPYVSSDFTLDVTLLDQPIATKHYTWHPFYVVRSGSVQEIVVETVTMLIPGSRAGLMEMTLKNRDTKPREAPVAIAQGIIFGMFGVHVEANGDILINPQPPSFAKQITLNGLRLRRRTLSIAVDGGEYEVREGNNKVHVPIGPPVLVRGNQLLRVSADGKTSF